MASMLGLPILVFCERGIDGGIFDEAMDDQQIYRAFLDDDWQVTPFSDEFTNWCADVRERSKT